MKETSDLKLLDELLIDYMRTRTLKPADLEGDAGTSNTRAIMKRLRQAWRSGVSITRTWCAYFEKNGSL